MAENETQNGNENEATITLEDILDKEIVQTSAWPIDSSTKFDGKTSHVVLEMFFGGCTIRDLVNWAAKDRRILYQNNIQRAKSGSYKAKQRIPIYWAENPTKGSKRLTKTDSAEASLDAMPPAERDALIKKYLANKPQAENTGS